MLNSTALILYFFKIVCLDIGPQEYPDLEIAYEKVPDADNFYNRLTAMENKLHWPDSIDDEFCKMRDEKVFDKQILLDAIEKNSDLFNYLEEYLNCKHFQTPLIFNYTDFPSKGHWLDISNLMKIHFETTEREQRLNSLRLHTNYTKRFTEIECHDLLSKLVAVSVVSVYFEFVREHADTFSDQEITYILNQTQKWTDTKESYINAFKGEFRTFQNFLNEPDLMRVLKFNSLKTLIFLHPNRTIYSYGTLLAPPLVAFKTGQINSLKSNFDSSNVLKLNTNIAGRKLLNTLFPSVEGPLLKYFEIDANKSATVLALNCELYRRKYGNLPDSMNDLVPEFIPSVPLDPFDQKPMRYNKDKKTIYSVGQDQIDNGGIRGKDITFSFGEKSQK